MGCLCSAQRVVSQPPQKENQQLVDLAFSWQSQGTQIKLTACAAAQCSSIMSAPGNLVCLPAVISFDLADQKMQLQSLTYAAMLSTPIK